MSLDPLIGSQRNEGVQSLAKALPVHLRLRGGPQACYGILPHCLKLGRDCSQFLFSLILTS